MSDVVKLPDRSLANHVSWSMLMQAFLAQHGVRIFRTLCTVSVSFETQIAAEEFHKLIASKREKA